MASNADTLDDGSMPPRSPDWIEIYNAGDASINLQGWHLTDNANDLSKWTFPSIDVPAKTFLVVFASGNDAPDTAGNLHTNFRLAADGDYVALVRPDGVSVVSEYGASGSDYPQQVTDVSYGVVMQPTQREVVHEAAAARILIPSAPPEGDWTGGDPAFDDDPATTSWLPVTTAIGFSADGEYDTVTSSDIEAVMRGVNSSVLVRIPFEVDDPDGLEAMTLRVAYDDGFVAYLNGQKVAQANAPEAPTFDSAATAQHNPLGSIFTPTPTNVSILYDFEEDGGQAVRDKLTADGQQNPIFNSGGSVDTNPADAAFGGGSLHLPGAPPNPAAFNRLQLPGTAALGERFTLAVQADLADSGLQRLLSNYNGMGEVRENRLIFDIDPSGASIPGMRVAVGGRGTIQTSSVPLQMSEPGYHHFAIVYDDGDLQAYVDGQMVLSGVLGSGALDMPLDLFLGEDPHDEGGSASEQLIGNIDDLVVLGGVALTASDIRLLAEQGAEALFFRGGTRPIRDEFDVTQHRDRLRTGTNTLALQGLNLHRDDTDFLLLPELILQQSPDSHPPAYFDQPTPGALNGSVPLAGVVSDPGFSVGRGFYDSPISVEIAVDTPGASIIYTTDGSEPTPANGVLVPPPDIRHPAAATVSIDTTTVLRAAAFKDAYKPSNVATQSYFYLVGPDSSGVIHQPRNPDGLPRRWGPTVADYAMDPNIVEVAPYRQTIVEGLKSIPTVSLVLDPEDFFGPRGIYSNTTQRGRTWERPASVEFLDPNADGSSEFQVDAGLRVHGGYSRDPSATPQHSLRLHFRNEYGTGRLDFPLFADSDVTSFDSLVLNAQSSDNWTSANLITGRVAQFMRDQWAQDMQREMGHVHAAGRYVHLYINGLYWGLYDINERIDDTFAADHFGGVSEQYDVIIDSVAMRGNRTAWNDLLRRVRSGSYESVQELLDVDNFIDYMILNMYMGNWDWPDHNWNALRRRAPREKFKFLVWDAEVGLGLDANIPGPTKPRVLDVDLTGNRADVSAAALAGGPGEIYNRLRRNPEFQLRLADRLHKHLFNDGALTSARAAAVYESRATEIESALVAQAARWGDVRRRPPDVPDGVWLAEKNWILDTFFPQRGEIVLDQFRGVGLYPPIAAPWFGQHGGEIPPGFQLTISNNEETGLVVYTVDGSDPRLPGGDISPSARIYQSPIARSENTTVKARVFDDGVWSALSEASYALPPLPVRITEINYNPHGPTPEELAKNPDLDNDDFEFIELQNTHTTDSVRLSGLTLSGGAEFAFPDAVLQPGEFALIVEDTEAFHQRYGTGQNVLGQWAGRLANNGERLILADGAGNTLLDFAYSDAEPWPQRADGLGATLQLIDPTATPVAEYHNPLYWRDSIELGGSPGAPDAPLQGQPGDSNLDGQFDQRDMILVLQGGKYLTDRRASFVEGDWNMDGIFDQQDIVAALATGSYRRAL